jgi:hypothetical protein
MSAGLAFEPTDFREGIGASVRRRARCGLALPGTEAAVVADPVAGIGEYRFAAALATQDLQRAPPETA